MILIPKTSRVVQYFLPILLVIYILSGCAIPPTEPSKDLIGTLRVSGSNVFLNGTRAANGMSVYNGDNVTTGSNSSAIIVLPTGGFVQLDQNTDPIFTWERFQTGICLIVKILRGQAWVDESQYCVVLKTPDTDALTNSKVNVKVGPGRSVITVLQGNVTIEKPYKLRIKGSEQVAISKRGIEEVRKLTRQELRSVVSWRVRYEFQGWCCTDGEAFKSYPGDCKRRGGYFDYNEIEVRRRCQPRTGWCCSDGRVFESDPGNCERIGGYFSYDQKDAYSRCQPRTGWCCIPSTSEGVKGQVFQSTPNECRLKNGYFSYDRQPADERCLPRIY
ncbi:MAG: FecR family protein [Thermodesulfobacteriota bacterium]